ncbi:MAG: arginase family protein [Desulfobacterales bacterium]|nr:arginase family protein [Desulfobacterales bacterium]
MMKIGVLGVPFNGDGTRPEIENPAAALREAGLSRPRIRGGDAMKDYGDLQIPAFDGHRDPSAQILNLKAWKDISRHTAKKLLSIQEEVDFVILLGGDCSILLGVFGAFRLADRRVGLVTLDGHTDYRTPSSSPTGEPADLELAILTGRGPGEITGLFGTPPLLQPSDVVVCGYREPDLIMESGILHFDHHVFRETGAGNLAKRALSSLEHTKRLWFHFDVDVLDPALMPVNFPEPDGLSIDETLNFLSTAIKSGRFMGVSVACYHPVLDPKLEAASRVVSMLESALSQAA